MTAIKTDELLTLVAQTSSDAVVALCVDVFYLRLHPVMSIDALELAIQTDNRIMPNAHKQRPGAVVPGQHHHAD